MDGNNLSCRVRCCAHILNLITKGVLKGFEIRNKDGGEIDDEGVDWAIPEDEEEGKATDDADASDEEDDEGEEDTDELEQGPIENEDDYQFSTSLYPEAASNPDEDAQVDLMLNRAAESASTARSTISAALQREVNARNKEMGLIIKKVAWLATTLLRSPNKRRMFKRHCRKMGCDTPHTLLRDVATRWDSVTTMAERALQLWEGIISFSEAERSPVPKDKRLRRANEADLRKLVELLKPISLATKRFSEKSIATIGDVIGLFEDIDKYFLQVQALEGGDDDAMWRQAAARGHAVAAKYYGLTDQANVIALATLLHPNFRKHALKLLKWPDAWQKEAEQQLRDVFSRWYAVKSPSEEPRTESQAENFEQLDSMSQQLIMLHKSQRASVDPNEAIDNWLKEPITPLGAKGERVDPLRWWWLQREKGYDRGGLTALALDVFSCPATSVDVERLFSRAGRVVTPLRNKLKAEKIGQIISLGKWFTEGSVPDDLLVNILEARRRVQKEKRAQTSKATVAAKRKTVTADNERPSKRAKGKEKASLAATDTVSDVEE